MRKAVPTVETEEVVTMTDLADTMTGVDTATVVVGA
jgi:hypothetical protein